ncbi:MAG: hypothetical protein U5L10_02815 [Candidatus Moranbacteria bacterium]|nr:hypothetical protein [Candidatus Moranbacteria bacterium]
MPEDQYAVYGSGPMAVRGIREASDLDLMVKDEFYEELKNKYKEEAKGKIKLEQGKIEIFPAWNSLVDNPEEVISRAELIKGFKFIKLGDLIDWKRKMGRDKDFKDIRLIENFLQSGSASS